MTNRVLLVDGNLLIFKSFYASFNFKGNNMQNSEGQETNAIHTFFLSLFKVIKELRPTHIYIAFDKGSQTERHSLFPDYKQGRKKAPDSLFSQLNLLKEILTLANLKWSDDFDYEADDLIASMNKTFLEHDRNSKVFIFSSDQDLLQLVSNQTYIVDKNKDNSFLIKSVDNFYDLYNLFPAQIPDFKALSGDSSDNIKGVPGIGPKTAKSLIQEYETVENLVNNLDQLPSKMKEKLKEHKDNILLFKKLTTLKTDAKFSFDISEIALRISINSKLLDLLKQLELNKVIEQFHVISKV
ncbi:5'-3' exonuclease [Mycoplasma sp. 1654_15]|uniref:5'-3' exonuclease n=1 Tax=Mycoplasma sp. 1654_15 TaxID=2725994 RepID=UPI001449FB85|nr:5'-3' exonuclease [Mycoplasma sp. 1654_15]QJB71121.1 5'-3' exonuclease [Mycoplasma sp. 1654_15]